MTLSPFRIDVLDSSGDPVGTGSLRNILQINTVDTLDKIGTLSFIIPANDLKSTLIEAGRQFDVYDEVDGYIGRYIYRSDTKADMDGRGIITVQCWSILKELTYQIAGFARNYSADALEDVIDDLLGDVSPAWTLDIGTGLGTVSVTYQGQTYFQAIEELTKRWGYHFRLNSTLRELEYGSFGADNANVRLTNLGAQDSRFDEITDVAILKKIQVKTQTDEIYNRVVALGAGEGAAQLRLLDNQVGDFYTVDSRTRSNGQVETFIEDATSQSTYGVREIVLVFDQIRPIANTATAKTQAKTELLKNAERWLNRYKDARQQLDNVQVYGLKEEIKVGQKIPVRYKGIDDEAQQYISVDGDYWITQIGKNRNATGQRITTLQLVNVDRPEKTDIDIMADAIKGIKSDRLWIKPTAFRQSDTYIDYVQHGNGDYQDKEAEFTLTFDDTVMEITRVVLEWRTKPLYSMTIWTNPPSTNTGVNSNAGDPHTHLLLSGLDGIYQVLTDSNYPTDVSMEINGVNVDNHADVDYITGGNGEWNSGGTPNSALNIRMDITDFILNAGIYQTFDIVVKVNDARTRDVAVQYWSVTDPANLPYGNHGVVEMKMIVQGVAQGLYKD